MTAPTRDLATLLRDGAPVLHDEAYAFATAPDGVDLRGVGAFAIVAEAEGTTVVLPEANARAAGFVVAFVAARITWSVVSDLAAVGLTAAVATALAEAGIACNVVAGVRHDHFFVPFERGPDALARLRKLAVSVAGGDVAIPPGP